MGPIFEVWQMSEKNLYVRLTIEKMHAFVVFTKKYLLPCVCGGTNFTAVLDFENLKTEIQCEIIDRREMEIDRNGIIEIQI